MDSLHSDQLNGLTPAHDYFNKKYKKDHGTCIVDGMMTEFNEVTERYERLCSERCKKIYREQFKRRMQNKYGKVHLLNDAEVQKKMQRHRRIAGVYKWSDGAKFDYLGTYELDFLTYLDKVLGMDSKDILSPAPVEIPYKFEGKDHFYMPDAFIVPFNLLVEIKGTNKFYQQRDYNKELTKDEAAKKSKFNYVKVIDKNYEELVDVIDKLRSKDDDKPIINEDNNLMTLDGKLLSEQTIVNELPYKIIETLL
jgi:predicted nucleic acid-binding Zn ribbon protein